MKLFIAPGACSFASHVLVHELGLPIEVVTVSLTDPQGLHKQVSPFGRVPTLQLDDGTVITENTAILPFLADLKPGTPLFAPAGSVERAQIQSWLGYLSSEVHTGSFRPINRPGRYHADVAQHDQVRASGIALLRAALAPIAAHLQTRTWLVGERFTIADAYLGVFLGWIARAPGQPFKDDTLDAYFLRYQQRPAVIAAAEAEAVLLNAVTGANNKTNT
jgi:glutathione S-transferase